ncbi:MAG: hypothetical protein ACK4JD_07780 [Thermoflexales bacterium]
MKTSTVPTPAQRREQFLALAAQALAALALAAQAYDDLVAQAYDESETWYDQHPDATSAEIEAKSREVLQALMDRVSEMLINQRRHTADITPPESRPVE